MPTPSGRSGYPVTGMLMPDEKCQIITLHRHRIYMDRITPIAKFRNPYGNQEIELQQVEYAAGGVPMMRLRIRERGARFTIFDIDPVTAKYWAEEMHKWAAPIATQSGEES